MALKTNTNKATANLFEYIANTINPEEIGEGFDVWTATRTDFSKAIVEYFETSYYNGDNRKHKMTKQELFTEWASGLPLGIFDYYDNMSAVEIVGDILEETEEEKAKYTEEQASALLTYMIFRNAYKYGKE